MSGLRFEVTAENGGFIRRMEETRASLRERKKELDRRGKISLADFIKMTLTLILALYACGNDYIKTETNS